MAEEIIFKVSTDTGNSVKAVSDVEKALKGANASTVELNRSNIEASRNADKTATSLNSEASAATKASKAVEDLSKETEKAGQATLTFEQKLAAINREVESGDLTMRQLSKKIQEYQSIAIAAGRESPIGQEALAAAAQLHDSLGDLRSETARLGDDQRTLQGVMEIGGAVAAGYGAVQGAMALVGAENKNLQESLQKLMAVQTLLNSINQIKIALEKESAAMLTINAAKTRILAVTQTLWTAATTGTTVAMGVLNAAMMAIPIFLIIAAVVALIAVIYDMISVTEQAAAMNDKAKAAIERNAKASERAAKSKLRDIDNIIATAKAEGANAEELHQLELRRLSQEEENRVKLRKTSAKEIEILRIIYKKALKEGNTDLANSTKQDIQTTKDKYRDLKDLDGQYAIDKKNKETEFENEQREIAKQNAEKWAANRQAARDKEKAAEEKAAQEKIQAEQDAITRQRLISDLMIAGIEDEAIRKRTALLEAQRREKEDIEKKYGEDTEVLKELKVKQTAEILAADQLIKDEAAAKDLADQKEDMAAMQREKRAGLELELILMADDFEAKQEVQRELNLLAMEEELANTELTEAEIALIEEKYRQKELTAEEEAAEKKKQLQRDIQAAATNVAEQGLNAISAISDAVYSNQLNNAVKGSAQELAIKKKQFETSKKIQIAQAIISGANGVINALSAQSVIPEPFGTILKGVTAGLVVATTVANISKIKGTKFDGGGGSVSAPSVSAPSIPSAATAGGDISTLTGGLSGSGSTPAGGGGAPPQNQKVVLVDSDIKTGLNNVDKVNVLSSIG